MQINKVHEESGPIAKRSHKKSRRGCLNCKARKVKCDETRPLCNNCAKHYSNIQVCEWESTPPPRNRSLPSRPSGSSQARKNLPSSLFSTATSRTKPQPEIDTQVIGLDLLDPFATYPESHIHGIDSLLRNYLLNFVHRCFPFFNTPSIIRVWWPFVRDDIVLFHVILELSALHPSSSATPSTFAGEKMPREVMAECLRLLKERLADPFLRASDQTIAAVANLLAIEHSRGNVKAVKSHFSGLKLMLQLRNGLDSVKKSNSIVADIVYWTAMAVADDPLQLPFEFERMEDPAQWLRIVSDPMRYDFHRLELGDSFVLMMADIDALSQRFSVVVNNPSAEDSVAVVDALALTIQRILRLQLPTNQNVVLHALGESCRFAGALHLYSPLGGYYPDSTLMTNVLMHKLKMCLSIVLDSDYENDYLILWLLQVGGISAVTLPERSWFVGHLASVSEDLGVETWLQAESALTFVIWHAVFCKGVFENMWKEVEVKRRSLCPGEE